MLSTIPESAARPLLERAMELQDALFLGLVALPAGHIWPSHPAIAAWVMTLPHWQDMPNFVRNRFAGKKSVWSSHVAVIARALVVTKTEMHRVWTNHRASQALYTAGAPAALEMPDWNQSPEWSHLRDLMSSFYDAVLGSDEFPLPAGQSVSRNQYQVGFRQISICPYWDCALTRGELELDHFFPRSVFPFHSIDPDNLVPVSHGPNRGGHKGAKVALDDAPLGHARPATKWFHPRWRPAEGKLDAEVKRPSGDALAVHLKPTAPAYQDHVENLDRLLDLTGYWTEEANRTFRSDQADIGQEVKDYAHAPNTTVASVIQRRIRNYADRQVPRALALLNQRKFESYLTDLATCAEIQKQVNEMSVPFRAV